MSLRSIMAAVKLAPSTTERIPLVDLQAQHKTIAAPLSAVVRDVMARGAFTLGAELGAFEEAFAAYCGVPHAVGVASGTDALFLALKALDLGPGDEVLVPALTFAATAEAVVYCGARPVFVDVRPSDLQMDPRAAEAAISARTVGLLPVHLYGMAADVVELGVIASRHGLWLVEDAAQAHGAEPIPGRRVGSFGIAGCFSFYPSKNLGACGDGGMITTSDSALAERLTRLRHHGQASKYEHVELGYCSRLDTLQAAILGVKLPYLDRWNAARRRAAALYDEMIGDRVERVGKDRREGSVQHVYAVRIPAGRRADVVGFMRERNIEVGVHYPQPLHQIPHLGGATRTSLPVSEQACREVLSLPIYPEITVAQQERVVAALLAALALRRSRDLA